MKITYRLIICSILIVESGTLIVRGGDILYCFTRLPCIYTSNNPVGFYFSGYGGIFHEINIIVPIFDSICFQMGIVSLGVDIRNLQNGLIVSSI